MKKIIRQTLWKAGGLFLLLMGIALIMPQHINAATLSNPRVKDGVSTWDCVYFGNYYQSDITGKTKDPIKWRVLSVNGDDAFLVADQNLDAKDYNTTYEDVTWENCTLRSWLNGYGDSSNVCGTDYAKDNFIDTAFSSAEKSAIKTTDVESKKW